MVRLIVTTHDEDDLIENRLESNDLYRITVENVMLEKEKSIYSGELFLYDISTGKSEPLDIKVESDVIKDNKGNIIGPNNQWISKNYKELKESNEED